MDHHLKSLNLIMAFQLFVQLVTFLVISCGIIGNNGPIDPDGATKATQFIQLCDQAK